jgi:hypothetical protein
MIEIIVQDLEKELVVNVPKKRGRKSKKDIENALNLNVTEKINVIMNQVANIESPINNNTNPDNTIDTEQVQTILETDTLIQTPLEPEAESDTKKATKKRGRKPKGGKIIQQTTSMNDLKDSRPNVILHLKCSSKDLINNNSSMENLEIESYNFASKHELSYDLINKQMPVYNNTNNNTTINNTNNLSDSTSNINDEDVIPTTKSKEIWSKLKQLEHDLHINNSSGKKSACFWCTYDFDNPPVYIPKHFIKDSYHVYGCFCSPECAVAHLMNENIDSSIRFERYHLINQIYGKVYNYEKNIKPAPDPYYMLEKYYGNLTIQEYRSLLRNERLFLIVDKPLTRILPELHEDNDEFILNNKIIPSNTYQIKKKIQKKCQTKNTAMNEHFGIST